MVGQRSVCERLQVVHVRENTFLATNMHNLLTLYVYMYSNLSLLFFFFGGSGFLLLLTEGLVSRQLSSASKKDISIH